MGYMAAERKGLLGEMTVPKAALITVGVLVILGFSVGLVNALAA
jgi:hypothetical protein